MGRAVVLMPITVRAPGHRGLNTEGDDIANSPDWAQVAKNLVYDNSGRLASRKGYTNVNDLSGTDDVEAIFVYDYSGGTYVISATADHLYEDSTDRQGSLAHTTANWQFQNFNGKVVGAQDGQTMIVKTGTGNFAAISPKGGGTVDADGNCVHAAFGRLWATSDATTLVYSGLLDETEWPSATTPGDSGSFNILSSESAVRSGYDEIVAINHIQDKLVVFLRGSIVVLDVPEDPANMIIYKVIDNVGCIARDSVQAVGNDLVFLSRDGVRSLVRAIAEDNLPVRDLSVNVRSDLIAAVSGTPADVKSAYYPDEGLYILLFTGDTAYVFDFKRGAIDDEPRVTTWEVPTWHSLYYYEGTLYIGQEGEYGKYDGYQEDGAAFMVEFKTVNCDFESPNIKIMKLTQASFVGANNQQITFTYDWDYELDRRTESTSLPAGTTAGVYGTGTYGSAVFGPNVKRAQVRVNPGGNGEILAFGFRATVDGAILIMEQLSQFVTLGRLRR